VRKGAGEGATLGGKKVGLRIEALGRGSTEQRTTTSGEGDGKTQKREETRSFFCGCVFSLMREGSS